MVSYLDVSANDLLDKAAETLKKINAIKAPEWAEFVKTGTSKERPPARADWWYIRTAAVLRSVAKLGPVGVAKLRTKYGGRKNMGHKPDRFYKGSGNILRKILQQLEKADLVKKVEKSAHKGRIITPRGVSLLSKAAYEATKIAKPKEEPFVERKEAPKEMPAQQRPQQQPRPQQPSQSAQPHQKPQQPQPKPQAAPAPEAAKPAEQ